MKTIKFFALLCLVAMPFAITSCSSDDGEGGGGATLGTIKAKVGNSNFNSTEATTTAVKINTGGTAHMITLYGMQMDMSGGTQKVIQLMMNVPDLEPRSYDIGGENLIGFTATYTEASGTSGGDFTSTSWAAPYEGGEVAGQITITEISETNIKGTFSFTAQKQNTGGWIDDFKDVTNGAFNVNFND